MSLTSFKKKISSGPLAIALFGMVVLCVGVLAFTGIGQSITSNHDRDSTPGSSANSIVAKVNNVPVTVAQYQSALSQERQKFAGYGTPPTVSDDSTIRVQAFNEFILQPILVANIAAEHGLTVSDDELTSARNKALAKIKTELGLQPSASDSDINTALQADNSSMTVDDLVDNNALKSDVLRQKYLDYLTQANQATEDRVEQYYQQSTVRYILINNKTRPDAQAKALAADLIARLSKGADFSQLAKQYSDDPSTKNKGGELGVVSETSSFAPEFKTAALSLKAGQVTNAPVLAPEFGYFVIKCDSVTTNLPKDYKKNHSQYVAQVTETLVDQQANSDLTAEKAKAKIDPIDPRLVADLALGNPQGGTSLQTAADDYQKALANADDSDKAEIYASLAQVYQQMQQPDKEMAALTSALGASEDSTLRLQLGDLYRQKGDTANALKQYQFASQNSYNNPDIHIQLMQDYRALKQPQLVAAESDWLKQYRATQKQANSLQPAGQMPIQ